MPQDETPEIFHHYRILRREDGSLWELGRGAMGVTYKAEDTNLHKAVALKVINSLFLNNQSARERFIREARAAASLSHRNVATVYHLGHDEQSYFYAMEFIDGATVESVVVQYGPQPWPIALRYMLQVTRALMAAHDKHLVHRDIKPANLMLVTEAGEDELVVKVIDFGLAKSLVEVGGSMVNVSGSGFVGTPLYASPEQCEEIAPDIRSDIYSLGVVLWYVLTGKPLFNGSLGRVFAQHISAEPAWDKLPADLPENVRVLLARMLTKDRATRPQTPAELRREIDECLRPGSEQETAAPPLRASASLAAAPLDRPAAAEDTSAALLELEARAPGTDTTATLAGFPARPAAISTGQPSMRSMPAIESVRPVIHPSTHRPSVPQPDRRRFPIVWLVAVLAVFVSVYMVIEGRRPSTPKQEAPAINSRSPDVATPEPTRAPTINSRAPDVALPEPARAVEPSPAAVLAPDPQRLSQEKLAALFVKARETVGEAKWREAIDAYTQVLELAPASIEALDERGTAHDELGETELAKADYARAKSIEPTQPGEHYYRADAIYSLYRNANTVADNTVAVSTSPGDAYGYFVRGSAYVRLKKYEEAIKDYTEAIRLNPQYARAFSNRGGAYRHLQKYEEAIKDYTEAIRLNPLYAYAINDRGIAYNALSKYEEAIKDYTEAIRLNPQLAYVFNNRGNVYYSLKKHEEAIKDFSEAIRIDPNYKQAYRNRADAYRVTGKSTAARNDEQTAAKLP